MLIVYEESLSGSPSGVPSRDYNSPIPDYVTPYIPTSDPCESWPTVVACSVPSTGSTSPSSSANDEYGYMPAPTLPDGSRLPPTSVPMIEGAGVDYDDVERSKLQPILRWRPAEANLDSRHHRVSPRPWRTLGSILRSAAELVSCVLFELTCTVRQNAQAQALVERCPSSTDACRHAGDR